MTSKKSAHSGWQLIGLLVTLLVAIIARDMWAMLVLLLALGLSAWLAPAALRPVFRWRWLILMALLIIPSALWVGIPDVYLAGMMISQAGLQLGLEMACRATTIFVAVNVFSQSISVMELTNLLDRYGMRGLGFAIGVGFHALPTLKKRFVAAYAALRLRGGFRRRRWRAVQLLFIIVITGALRYGEEVVLAAEARAFDPDGG